MEVIFRGEKYIAEVDALLEFILVHHCTFGVIEVIGSVKKQSIEANRLYIDDTLVRKEAGPDNSQVAAFLANAITVCSSESKRLQLCLPALESLVCYKPLGLKPYVPNKSVPADQDVSPHDLWRIPALFACLSDGKTLGEADAKLWAAFTWNKCEADVVKTVAAMLAAKLSEKPEIVEGAVQASTMPCNTPFPGHSELGSLKSSRSFSDFAKMSLDDNNPDDLFALPPMVRTQSYGSSISSPRSIPASPSHRKGELMVPSPSHRIRAPLPRSGTNSTLSSPTARTATTSGIADTAMVLNEQKIQTVSNNHSGHKRVRSLGVLDSLKDALSRSLLGSPGAGDRVDTASSSDSNLSSSRGIAVDGTEGGSSRSIGIVSSGSGSAKKALTMGTPPMSPRPPVDAADIFPPHSAMSRSNSFSSLNGGTSSRRHSFVTGQMIPVTPPPSAKKNAYAGLDCGSADSASNNNNGFSPQKLSEGIRERNPSRSSSPSLLRSFTHWGSSSSNKIVPGGWEDENSF